MRRENLEQEIPVDTNTFCHENYREIGAVESPGNKEYADNKRQPVHYLIVQEEWLGSQLPMVEVVGKCT